MDIGSPNEMLLRYNENNKDIPAPANTKPIPNDKTLTITLVEGRRCLSSIYREPLQLQARQNS